MKKVVKRVAVAADGTSADPWAWRKYGQKPIKGSPYPRGYYRCSTDKACAARKMVERCRDNPDGFILTNTGGEHSHPAPVHRNSLAGTAQVPRRWRRSRASGSPRPAGRRRRRPRARLPWRRSATRRRPSATRPTAQARTWTMDGNDAAGVSPLLNVVEETFVVTPWATTQRRGELGI